MKSALIGCGRIGVMLEHDPLRYKPCTHYGGARSAGLHIQYACDINPKRLATFARMTSLSHEQCYTDYSKLLQEIKPELVIIATWTESHAEICKEAARNNAAVIVLEKPITHSLASARQIIDTCSRTGTALIINHERRYLNKYLKLKKLIEKGALGDIKTVHASMLTSGYWGDSNIFEGGGPLLHDGTHMIDILRFLFGDIRDVMGEFQRENRSSGFEDRAAAWLRTTSGVDIFLETGGNREYFIFNLEISGTKGNAVIGNGYEKLYKKKQSRYYTGFNDLVAGPFPRYAENNCFHDLYKEVRAILHGKKTTSRSTGMDGYHSLEVIHGIYLSAYKGRKTVAMPLKQNSINIKKIFDLQ